MTKVLSKISNGTKFLSIVIFLYISFAIFKPEIFNSSIINSLKLFKDIILVITAVFILMFFSNLFLDTTKLTKLLNEKNKILGFMIAIFLGVISSGPIYMWYPLLSDMQEKGIKNSLITTFLYNRAIKIPLLPIMIYYFSLKLVIIISLYMIIFSVINGILVEKSLTIKK